MTRAELLEEIYLLWIVIVILVGLCIILYSKLTEARRDSNLWTHQFYALKNKFNEMIQYKEHFKKNQKKAIINIMRSDEEIGLYNGDDWD